MILFKNKNNYIYIRIHLPAMFIGMQHLQVANFQLAEGFLTVAYDICDSDPTLLNELGVLYFNKQEYVKNQKSMKYKV